MVKCNSSSFMIVRTNVIWYGIKMILQIPRIIVSEQKKNHFNLSVYIVIIFVISWYVKRYTVQFHFKYNLKKIIMYCKFCLSFLANVSILQIASWMSIKLLFHNAHKMQNQNLLIKSFLFLYVYSVHTSCMACLVKKRLIQI